MPVFSLHTYIHSIFSLIPGGHWWIMVLLASTVPLCVRKKCSVYGAVSLGIVFFVGLFLLDIAVLIRVGENTYQGIGVDLSAEYYRLLHGGQERQVEMLSNVVVFIPFGFFLSEFMSAGANRLRAWHRFGFSVLFGFGLSLCVECLQLVFHVGVFEFTDLVMNTVGTAIGAGLSVLGRKAFCH